jgi:hypothetical protein
VSGLRITHALIVAGTAALIVAAFAAGEGGAVRVGLTATGADGLDVGVKSTLRATANGDQTWSAQKV